MEKILELSKKQKITHALLAEKVGTSRPKITNLLNNHGIGCLIDLLIRVLGAPGQQAHLRTTPIAG